MSAFCFPDDSQLTGQNSGQYTTKGTYYGTCKSRRGFCQERCGKNDREGCGKGRVKSEDIQKKFTEKGPLQRFIRDAKLLVALVRDYWKKIYRQVPYGTIGAIVFTLIYVLNPFDLVPDILPIIGELDDAAVFAAGLMLVESDLRKYEKWKEDQPPLLGED